MARDAWRCRTPTALADPCNNQACLQRPFSQAGGPYVGDWCAHNEHVVVNADGSGMLFFMGGGDQNFPFCKQVGGSNVNSVDCGA